MRQDKIKLLTDALRSGEYKQHFGNLRRDDRFCILGVACDIYAKKTGKAYWTKNNFQSVNGTSFVSMPYCVNRWFDFKSVSSTLMKLNDNEKLTFEQLADFIDKEGDDL